MPTLGNTNVGASNRGNGQYDSGLCKITVGSSNINVDSISCYTGKASSGSPTCGLSIYDSSGNIYGASLNFTNDQAPSWRTVNYSTKPLLYANSIYYLRFTTGSVISDSSSYLPSIYFDTITGGGGFFNYPNFFPTPPQLTSYTHSIYITYSLGPSLKIEGITPSKLDGTSWSSISNVR